MKMTIRMTNLIFKLWNTSRLLVDPAHNCVCCATSTVILFRTQSSIAWYLSTFSWMTTSFFEDIYQEPLPSSSNVTFWLPRGTTILAIVIISISISIRPERLHPWRTLEWDTPSPQTSFPALCSPLRQPGDVSLIYVQSNRFRPIWGGSVHRAEKRKLRQSASRDHHDQHHGHDHTYDHHGQNCFWQTTLPLTVSWEAPIELWIWSSYATQLLPALSNAHLCQLDRWSSLG